LPPPIFIHVGKGRGKEKSSQLGFLKDEKRKATDNGWRQNRIPYLWSNGDPGRKNKT